MATIIKRGDSWRAQVRRAGNRPLSKTFQTKDAAAAWAREIEHQIDRGQTVDAGRRVTFGELVRAYREQLQTPNATGRARGIGRSKAQILDKLERQLGPRRLIELKAPTFIDFCRTRESEGAGPATILQNLTYIGTVLRHGGALINAEHAATAAVTALESARRALRHTGRVANAQERSRRPTDEELRRLLDYWSGNPRQHIPMVDITLFAVATAMRLG